MSETELRRRIVALELAVDRLTVELSELKARPQPAQTIGGAGGWAFPWGTLNPAKVELSQTTGAIGTNVSRETPKGMNGAVEFIGLLKTR